MTEPVPLSPKGLGSISRGFIDPKTNSLIAAFRYPGAIGFVGRMDLATGKLTKLQEIKGMMLYRVTSLAFDPDARTAYYTEDNYAFRDIIAVNVDTGKKRMLLKDARIGDLVVNPTDKSIWGIRHQNGFATLVRIPAPYSSFNQVHTFKYGQTPFDLDISPDGTLISASFGEINGDSRCGSGTLTLSQRRRRPAGSRAPVAAAVDAGRFRLRARRQDDVRHVLLHRRLERLPLRYRQPQKYRRGQQCLDRLLPADPAARRNADRLRL